MSVILFRQLFVVGVASAILILPAQFEVVSISLAASDENSAPFDEKPQRETVHFWLCGRCAATSTLVLEPAKGLKLISVDEASRTAADQTAVTSDMLQAKRC